VGIGPAEHVWGREGGGKMYRKRGLSRDGVVEKRRRRPETCCDAGFNVVEKGLRGFDLGGKEGPRAGKVQQGGWTLGLSTGNLRPDFESRDCGCERRTR